MFFAMTNDVKANEASGNYFSPSETCLQNMFYINEIEGTIVNKNGVL